MCSAFVGFLADIDVINYSIKTCGTLDVNPTVCPFTLRLMDPLIRVSRFSFAQRLLRKRRGSRPEQTSLY